MEWFYRLCQEPRRLWKRYIADFWHFTRLITLQVIVMRRREAAEPRLSEVTLEGMTMISVSGPLDFRVVPELQFVSDRILNTPAHLILDMQATTSIDSVAMGALLNLAKRAAYVDREVRVFGPSGQVSRALKAAKAGINIPCFATAADAIAGHPSEILASRLESSASESVLTLRGRATVDNASELRKELDRVPRDAQFIVIDLQPVGAVDSSAVAMIHKFVREREACGAEVRIVPGASVGAALRRASLQRPFKIASPRPDKVEDGASSPGIRTST
jgi:anti-anti-sigma factor